jgi:hypothetical protein
VLCTFVSCPVRYYTGENDRLGACILSLSVKRDWDQLVVFDGVLKWKSMMGYSNMAWQATDVQDMAKIRGLGCKHLSWGGMTMYWGCLRTYMR